MPDQFREVEAAFGRLKEEFAAGKITQTEFIDSLKQLRIKDEDGRFWMIGVQSGKWYYYDGRDWVQAKPPSLSERKAICIYCGFENDLESETCARCGSQKTPTSELRTCPECGTPLQAGTASCPVCRPEAAGAPAQDSAARPSPASPVAEGRTLLIRAVHLPSFFWFFGIAGIFAGMLLGLLVGVTGLFPHVVSMLPGFLADIQGKLLGGVVFTIAGGLLGFVVAGTAGYLAAAVSNGILSLVGGVRVEAQRTSGPPGDKARS
jgi:hypothetical protein